jgi:hypothetical protein
VSASAGHSAEGEDIGPFRVVRRIGGGGMGTVYEAVDTSLDRRVALKVIAPDLAEDPRFRDRFTAEARALAALDSPHVVQVHAHGEHCGRLYLVTQLIPDGDLAALIGAHGPPPLRVGLDLVAQVASGLADVHAAGLVHRDIKPANILLRRRGDGGSAYLGDFGVARRSHGGRSGGTGSAGTPYWMAPELLAGDPAGVASDVYALGCVLWATVSGRAPFTGRTEAHVVSAHREQPVPQLVGDSPIERELNRILRRAMAKDPAARYGSAVELRDDLRHAATLPDVVGRKRLAPRWAARAAAAALVGVVAAAVAAAVVWFGGDGPAAPPPGSPTSDRARAVASLARALADREVMGRREAECTARRWIEKAGLRPMAAAGFFDADFDYVDRERTAMTPRIRAAASKAARACAHTTERRGVHGPHSTRGLGVLRRLERPDRLIEGAESGLPRP